jgi:hypothetical protein
MGANSVIRASNGKDLLMFYEAGNQATGNQPVSHWEYNVMALARSTDEGLMCLPSFAMRVGSSRPRPIWSPGLLR